jgi:hypothetical protein
MNMLARNCRLKYKSNDTVTDRIHPDKHIEDMLLPLTLPPESPDDALLITGASAVAQSIYLSLQVECIVLAYNQECKRKCMDIY